MLPFPMHKLNQTIKISTKIKASRNTDIPQYIETHCPVDKEKSFQHQKLAQTYNIITDSKL